MRAAATTGLLAIVLAVFAVCTDLHADIYKWTDEDGVTHFATSLEDVPERYRDQVETRVSTPEPERAAEAVPAKESETAAPQDADEDLGRFEIPYEPFEGSARRIIIPVTFNDRVTVPMALDTGAPGMVISVGLATRLGLFSRDGGTLLTEAGGIGGSQIAVRTIVDSVSVQRARDTFVPTTITAPVSEAFEGLIGLDFLTNYTISIDSKRQVLVFRQTPPDPSRRGGHDEAWWRKTFEDFRAARDYWRERAETFRGRPDSDAAAFIEFQARESQRLLQRLDNYASDNAVPRHWR